jgi:hypothetical protein
MPAIAIITLGTSCKKEEEGRIKGVVISQTKAERASTSRSKQAIGDTKRNVL